MRLEYRSNNAYDTIILVDPATGLAVSRWDVTPVTTGNFLDASQDADQWDNHHNNDNPDDFGELLGSRESGGKVILSESLSVSAEQVLARMQAELN